MPLIRLIVATFGLGGLVACAPVLPDGTTRTTQQRPQGAPEGTCWDKIITPAVVETITAQVQVQPAKVAPDGTVLQPAIYQTDTHQNMVQHRSERWFQTPCPADMTPEFIASVQRALQARDYYTGPITGQMDVPTRTALRLYQLRNGLDTDILSLETARSLGLVSILTQE